MILDELVLHNFGVYRGRQAFDLSPEPGRPIILVGARNGAGKTTFLEGLQLAFFGRLAFGALRGATSYEDYLRRAINRGVPGHEGAEVQVTFRRSAEGTEHVFTIRRAWTVQKGGVREVFEAVVDGKLDRVLTAHWAEFVEDMLPPRIAPLFFFDGEKIEQFADLERSAEMIGTAVSALLGLDIVERLQVDLEVLERRKAASTADRAGQTELASCEAEVEACQRKLTAEHTELGAATLRRDRQRSLLGRGRAKLKAEGGDLFVAREDLLAQRAQLESRLDGARKELRRWASESAPLLLVGDLLRDTARQAEREAETDATRTVLAHLGQRDERTLAELASLGAEEALLIRARAFFDTDRRGLARQSEGERHLDLSSLGLAGLNSLLEGGLAHADAERQTLLRQLESLEAERDDLDRKVASIPAADKVAPLLRAVTDGETSLGQAEADVVAATRCHEAAERELAAARGRLQAKLDVHVQRHLAEEDALRVVEHASRVRATLRQFKGEVVRHHVHRIERLIVQALQQLLRKSDLVVDVQIDPDTFAISLRGGGWDALPPQELSAGERQIFAVALLWALAQASGQAAPTVIDTPLGRLDSGHRIRLVDHYFPNAAAQVVLLSTDKEIDERLYARLAPALSRSFTIVYDAESHSSHVEPGYAFTTDDELEAA